MVYGFTCRRPFTPYQATALLLLCESAPSLTVPTGSHASIALLTAQQ